MQTTVNLPITIPFTSTGLVTGLLSFTPSFLLNGSTTVVTPVTYAEIGGGQYTMTFTPTTSGILTVFVGGQILPYIEVVSRTTYAILQNLEDEAIGSWVWDKTAGSLSLVRQNGTPLANFNVVDTISNASRERI